ncbi:hypothetical protein BDY19DRAFT_985505 [Irpex rosettiformis]|uniref:Uncharacterized protein n=1 Tax=Irpex rosettiformis TaxID=378272 RepID=A0ACB8U388_9APHY|nr:hypothetical protein BDY19DRAFT_985505 [Irpex rosettiformis]
MPSYVVTGSSRGLGLGFVQAISNDPTNAVFAVVRSKSSASQLLDFVAKHSHKNVHIIEANNKDAHALQNAADIVSKITGGTLDILINNSALMAHERGGLTLDAFPSPEILEDDLVLYFRTNAVGPIHTINAFLPLLLAGNTKKCIAISTTLGSPKVTNAADFGNYAGYGISKAALNLAIAKYACRFRDQGLLFLSINPGLVKTAQGPKEQVEAFYESRNKINREKNPDFEGAITVERSVGDILAFIDKATIADSGKFVHRDGRDGDSF